MPKPLTIILLTVGLIIVGLLVANSKGGYSVNCLCMEGQECECPNFAADAALTFGLLLIAAGASLPVIALISARKKAIAS